MNFSQSGSITILIFVIAVFIAGCTESVPPAPSVTTPHITAIVTKTTAAPSVTPARQPATTVQVKVKESPVKIFDGEYHWVEYRENNTVTMPPNPRYQWESDVKMERSTGKYEGSPAVHYITTAVSDYPEWIGGTLTVTTDGRTNVDDSWYDISTEKYLGGTGSETIKGVTSLADYSAFNAVHRREDSPGGWMGITPFGEMNITLIDLGTESVIVPAGIYPGARKYTGNFRDGTPITFWVAPGIPVPVQYRFPNKYLDGENPFQSYELKGWG